MQDKNNEKTKEELKLEKLQKKYKEKYDGFSDEQIEEMYQNALKKSTSAKKRRKVVIGVSAAIGVVSLALLCTGIIGSFSTFMPLIESAKANGPMVYAAMVNRLRDMILLNCAVTAPGILASGIIPTINNSSIKKFKGLEIERNRRNELGLQNGKIEEYVMEEENVEQYSKIETNENLKDKEKLNNNDAVVER